MLAEVDLAEEGVLQLLLASVYRLLCSTRSDHEAAVSSKYISSLLLRLVYFFSDGVFIMNYKPYS